MMMPLRRVVALDAAVLSALVLAACTVPQVLISQNRNYSGYDMSFDAPAQLMLEEYTLDLATGYFRKGPARYDQGVIMSAKTNFILEWVYEPDFTPNLARRQALNGPAFFESTNTAFQATLIGGAQSKSLSDFDVVYAEMQLSSAGVTVPGIIAVWQCQPSERAIIFIAINKRPIKEMERFVGSFACT